VIAAILAMTKDLGHWQRRQEEGAWKPTLLDELAGSRVLIVGYGSIGRAVEERLAPFDVSVERIASRAGEDDRLVVEPVGQREGDGEGDGKPEFHATDHPCRRGL
jgi:phosphoglycerate dehydrogenase-like enzyme